MDAYALGLRKAAKMQEDDTLDNMINERFSTWAADDIEAGEATPVEECCEYAKSKGELPLISGKQKMNGMIRNRFIHDHN
jgi:xylose isomerase